MARQPYQILVLPYRRTPDGLRFAVFRRADEQTTWQMIAGGGEEGETPDQTARREAFEEAGIDPASPFLRLDATASLPANVFAASAAWGPDVFVIPEHAFAVEVEHSNLRLSSEHVEVRWTPFHQAIDLLRWDSNKVALWELRERLTRGGNLSGERVV